MSNNKFDPQLDPRIPTSYQTLYYPEARNKAKFIREESLRSDEDTLDCIELVDLFAE